MHEITSIQRKLTDTRTILGAVKKILTVVDPEFPEVQRTYEENVAKLCSWGGDRMQAYLEARDRTFAREVLYFAGQGLLLNMDIFHSPVHELLLHSGYESLSREYLLESLPGVQQARYEAKAAWEKISALPLQAQQQMEEVGDYYAYLETVGYKVAHYVGFRLADGLLYDLLPGYASNQGNTIAYAGALQQYLNVNLDLLE